MHSRDFCFWLQGFFELQDNSENGQRAITVQQAEAIKRHLALVFQHEIDPAMGNKAHQDKLNEIHSVLGPKGPNDVVMRC